MGTPAGAIAVPPPIGFAELVSGLAWLFVGLPLLIVCVLGLVDLLRGPLPGPTKALWVLLIVLLPVVGTLLYFTFRKPSAEEVRRGQAAAAELRHTDPRTSFGSRPPID